MPASRFAVALEDLDGRRLAGAVRAEQAEHLTCLDREVDPAQRLVVAVALAQTADRDGAQSSTSTNAAGSNRSIRPAKASTSSLQSGWWPTATTVSPSPVDCGANAVGRRPGREPLVDLDRHVGCARDLAGGLARAKQRAREDELDRLRRPAVAASARAVARPAVGQRPQLIRFAGRCLGVAHDEQAHVPSVVRSRRRQGRVTMSTSSWTRCCSIARSTPTAS